MASLPTGTVTFTFTDIEGSTLLLRRLGDDYADVLALHRQALRTAFKNGGGQEISHHGDEFFVAFSQARDAVATAVAAQRAITAQPWPPGTLVRVRMGLHTGEPLITEAGYVGMDVHRAARICAVGHGGQILLSQTTRDLIAEDVPPGVILHDLGEHRLKDLAHPEHLFQITAPGLRSDFPPLRSLGLFPNNLPHQLTSFVGREKEVAEVKEVLTTTPLVTLTGIGGAGKTRLALQVAADLLNECPDGVWLVELATLSDPALIPKTVALALGVREEPDRPLTATLLEFARPRKLLLLLDNCEHLLPGCAQLVDTLLRSCPNLRVLTTSREPLGIFGEAAWPVPPLSLPDRHHPQSVDALMQCEAVRLFAVRAVLNQPKFAVTPGNAVAVTQTCTTLDGIPLAIELAAARVKVLAVEQIAARLNDRFRLIAGGSRTALPRHQTLRAMMDWSYDLLSEEERTLLRRLSVFAGGWTLEAAEAICPGQEIRATSVLDLLTQLVTKSLVIVQTEGGEARYRQLETVRQYGRDRMAEAGETVDVSDRHQDWYVALGERAAPELVGKNQAGWLDRLEAEHDNLRAALAWSTERGHAEAGLRLAGAIWRFWLVRGYLAEGRGWLETLLESGGGVADPVRASALLGAGNLAVFGQADYASGAVFEKSLAIWRELGDKRRIADVLNSLGILAGALGDQASARARHEESLAIRRELEDRWGIGVSLHNLGRVAYREGQYETARALFEQSLALWRNLGDWQHVAIALSNLGSAATHLGDYASAAACLREGQEIVRKLGDKRQIAYSLEAFACLASARGRAVQAAQMLGAAEALREAISARLPPVDRPDYDHWMTMARTALGNNAFQRAWAQGRTMSPEDAMLEARSLEG